MNEIIICGMPATTTNKIVTGIFSRFGLIVSCELQHNTKYGLFVKLKMANAEIADWLVRAFNGSMAAAKGIGLESPLFMDSFIDSGWMWKT